MKSDEEEGRRRVQELQDGKRGGGPRRREKRN